MAKVPLTGDAFEFAVNVPGCAVKGADEFFSMAIAVSQYTAAVQAGINKGFKFIFTGAGDNNRLVYDLINMMITDFSNILFSTGHLPDFGP